MLAMRSVRSEKDWIVAPGCVRVHLVMHGSHVGYVVMTWRDWDNFLWEHPSRILEADRTEKTDASIASAPIVPESK